jgi:DNA-binding CsgD family transcriptional regulator
VRDRRHAGLATDREIAVVAAVLDAGSEKEAAHRLGLSHSTVKHHLANARSNVGATTTAQLVWILASRLPEPESTIQPGQVRRGLLPDHPDDVHPWPVWSPLTPDAGHGRSSPRWCCTQAHTCTPMQECSRMQQ